MKSYFDCVVIGAGVAGMTSAIYLKRYHLNVLLIEKNVPGGQIIQTPNVENYPGYKNIDGASLAMNILEQVNNLDIEIAYENVIKLENNELEKIVYTENREIHTKSIVLALGRVPKKLGIEDSYIGRGVSYCATCDGMFYKDKSIAVVGGGNSALEETIFLSDICKKVHLLYRGESLRADDILKEKIKNISNIEIHYNTVVVDLKGESKLEAITIKEKEEKKLEVEGLFIYIGFSPDTKLLENLIELDQGYVITNSKMETNIKGIYACGDVIKKDLYQLTTATGEASLAAYQVKQYITSLNS